MHGSEWTRATELRLSLAVFIAIVLANYSLHVLFAGAGWWFEMALTSAVVVGVAALTRAFTHRRYIPTVVASVAFVAFVVARFAADTAIFWVLPGFGTIGRFVDLADGASASIRGQSIPVNADTTILMLLVAAGASLMRGERFVHEDAHGTTHESAAEATAREGDALAVPAIPGEEVAYDDALAGRSAPN